MMKPFFRTLIIGIVAMCCTSAANAQGYIKLNGLYALGGVVNPQFEVRLTKHSAFQSELVYSPWKSIDGHHMHFGIFSNEYRYYFREVSDGFYVGAAAGIMLFDVSKPQFADGKLTFQNRYCKGYGCMGSVVVGYEWRFAERWLLDAYVGFGYLHSMYNGYSMDGEIDMYPNRPEHKQPAYPDPFNASAEWLPTKIGLSIGFLLWK
jgi:hypothetical protein